MSNRRTLSVILMLSTALGLAAGCASSVRARRPTSSRQIRGAEHVEFSSLDADLTKGAPTLIDGWLFRPAGEGPFPALVALHGCAGLFARNREFTARYRDWAERLVAQGYLVLFPDSFSPRGVEEICTGGQHLVRPAYERTRDAYAALKYLEGLPIVRHGRIGLFGWSNGGNTLLASIGAHNPARPKDLTADFRVAVAFYPGCKSILEHVDEWSPPVVPLHILTGESDDWTLAEPCVRLVEKARAAGSCAEITTYPGAFHDFDDPNMPLHTMHGIATTVSGTATLGTNPEARADALVRVVLIFRLAFAE